MLKLVMEPRARVMDGSTRRWTAGFALHTEGAKRYAIWIDQHTIPERLGRYELVCRVYCNGRELPENHRQDIRQTALGMYEETYGFARVLVLGYGLQWYKPLKASRPAGAAFVPSASMALAMGAELDSYRGR